MGFEDEVEQSIGWPYRQIDGRSKRTTATPVVLGEIVWLGRIRDLDAKNRADIAFGQRSSSVQIRRLADSVSRPQRKQKLSLAGLTISGISIWLTLRAFIAQSWHG